MANLSNPFFTLGLDGIELDIRKTLDGRLVSVHDRSLFFTCGVNKMVDQVTLDDIRKLETKSGHQIPTLEQIVAAVTKIPLIFDLKQSDVADEIVRIMNLPANSGKEWLVTSRLHHETARLKRLEPSLKILMTAKLQHPIHIVKAAKDAGAYGITVNIWVMNILTYWLAKRAGLRVMVYVYKPRFILYKWPIVKILWFIYPDLIICSDRADNLVKHLKR